MEIYRSTTSSLARVPAPPSPPAMIYDSFVHLVEKPARYIGGEYNAVVKDWDAVDCRFCLGFPDIYDIGMSHLGTKILYSILNKTPDLAMERVFCPWVDMEHELRERELPLVSLENHRPLSDFDVVGFSLQYEMTFTNVLTMMDLGGVPLRNADRTLEHPLVIAGGPTVTHPEPVAPFIDVFLVGDAEERLPRLLRHYMELKNEGKLTRIEILAELSKEGGVYCPDLYERELDPVSEMYVVSKPIVDGVPEIVERSFLDDISRYRFPDDSPVAVAEAIFDRMSVEIARGCTEGCRFCQAGMIYRPVRERDPEEIVDTVLSSLDKNGYDEASITSLSTADYSCISPLVKTLMSKLRERKVSLGISSLRAYGLSEDTLDEIATVKATGLTFAPEAGTQRMRDVINKNVTEEDIYETCHRIFSRGWNRMKLYFILGLPTEEDEDIMGIAEMGRQALMIGREHIKSKKVSVTVSVSSHVPKPHTPFQWAAMDTLDEIKRKQGMLWQKSKDWKFNFRRHNSRVSHLEGIIARGDIRVADIIEGAWNRGARFDGWDEQLKWEEWLEAVDEFEQKHAVQRRLFLDTIPVDARLPWDHIDVGLEDGFLLKEYRKSLKDRLSPPCGKPFRAKVHHTNIEEHVADERRLVCYDCGIACDMTTMRDQRLDFLTKLGAEKPAAPSEGGPTRTQTAQERHQKGLPPQQFEQGEKVRYRIRYTKLGPVSLQGHLDMVRILPRVLTRAGYTTYFSQGFSPKPALSFGPALGLGARSLGEYVDVTLNGDDPAVPDMIESLNRCAPKGLLFTGARRLRDRDVNVSKVIARLDWAVVLPVESADSAEKLTAVRDALDEAHKLDSLPVEVWRKKKRRTLDLWHVVTDAQLVPASTLPVEDDALPEGAWALLFSQPFGMGATLKPHEVTNALVKVEVGTRNVVRLGCVALKPDQTSEAPLLAGAPAAEDVVEWDAVRAREVREAGAVTRLAAASMVPDAVPSLLAMAQQ